MYITKEGKKTQLPKIFELQHFTEGVRQEIIFLFDLFYLYLLNFLFFCSYYVCPNSFTKIVILFVYNLKATSTVMMLGHQCHCFTLLVMSVLASVSWQILFICCLHTMNLLHVAFGTAPDRIINMSTFLFINGLVIYIITILLKTA